MTEFVAAGRASYAGVVSRLRTFDRSAGAVWAGRTHPR